MAGVQSKPPANTAIILIARAPIVTALALSVGQHADQPLVTIGAGALPLPTKQPPRLKPATTKANASANFFMGHPRVLLVFEDPDAFTIVGNERPRQC